MHLGLSGIVDSLERHWIEEQGLELAFGECVAVLGSWEIVSFFLCDFNQSLWQLVEFKPKSMHVTTEAGVGIGQETR